MGSSRTRRPGRAWTRHPAARIVGLALALGVGMGGPGYADDEAPNVENPATDENMPSVAEFEKFATQMTGGDDAIRATVQALRKLALESGAGQVRELEREEVMTLAARPVVALEFFRDTFTDVPALVKEDASGAWRYLTKWRRVANLMAARTRRSPQNDVAVALSRLADERANVLSQSTYQRTAARTAVATIRAKAAVAALPDSAWMPFLLECARLPTSDDDLSSVDWLGDELSSFAKRHPEDFKFIHSASVFDIDRGTRLLEVDPKLAGPALVRGLNLLGGQGVLSGNELKLIGVFNRGLTTAKRAGFSPTVGYRTEPRTSATSCLWGEVPSECGWQVLKVDGKQAEWSLSRVGGGLASTVKLWKYKITTDYVDDDGKVIGGDNVGARMKRSFDSWKAQVDKVKKISPTVGRLSKAIPGTRGFEVKGKNDEGIDFKAREWYWHGDVHARYVFELDVLQVGDDLDRDPEMDRFLESLAENGSK